MMKVAHWEEPMAWRREAMWAETKAQQLETLWGLMRAVPWADSMEAPSVWTMAVLKGALWETRRAGMWDSMRVALWAALLVRQ